MLRMAACCAWLHAAHGCMLRKAVADVFDVRGYAAADAQPHLPI
jgi:hypothetical protein